MPTQSIKAPRTRHKKRLTRARRRELAIQGLAEERAEQREAEKALRDEYDAIIARENQFSRFGW